jgi:hypothetical protein
MVMSGVFNIAFLVLLVGRLLTRCAKAPGWTT